MDFLRAGLKKGCGSREDGFWSDRAERSHTNGERREEGRREGEKEGRKEGREGKKEGRTVGR